MTLALFPTRRTGPTPTPARPRAGGLTVLVAPGAIDDHLKPGLVAEHIAEGVRRVVPRARIVELPIPGGGPGFIDALVEAHDGAVQHAEVAGPNSSLVRVPWGLIGSAWARTAVIEVAALARASGPPGQPPGLGGGASDGVGQLIRAALDAGARRVLIGGHSQAVLDGGLGLLQALGARAVDAEGHDVGIAGLATLRSLDLAGLDPRLRETTVEVAVDLHTRLLGPAGVARCWGEDHGHGRDPVRELDHRLARLANAVERSTGRWIGGLPGGGTGGGLAAAIAGVLGGTLRGRHELTAPTLPLDTLAEYADLIVTADARLGEHVVPGSAPALLAERALARRIPVIALGRSVAARARLGLPPGLEVCLPITPHACTAEASWPNLLHWLADAAERAMRLVVIGRRLDSDAPAAGPGGPAVQRTSA
jgi:glycerate 2-kinase